GPGRLEPTVETGNPPAQGYGAIPSEKRTTLRPVVGAIAADAGTIAASDAPAPVGTGGRTQEDQPRVTRRNRADFDGHQCAAGDLENRGDAQHPGPPKQNLQRAADGREVGGHCPPVCARVAPNGVGRPGVDSRAAFVCENLFETDGDP